MTARDGGDPGPDPAPDSGAGVPVTLHLDGQRVLCVGGGAVAAAKVLPLVDAGARLIVVAPQVGPEVAGAIGEGRVHWHRRGWEPADLDGTLLVLAATADPQVNSAVVAAAAARATLCVRVDRGGRGSADLAAAVRRGPLTIAIGTGGRAPALSGHLRRELAGTYGPEWGVLTRLYGELRDDPAVRTVLAGLDDTERRRRWRSIPVPDILRLIRSGSPHDAKRVATACLSSSSD